MWRNWKSSRSTSSSKSSCSCRTRMIVWEPSLRRCASKCSSVIRKAIRSTSLKTLFARISRALKWRGNSSKMATSSSSWFQTWLKKSCRRSACQSRNNRLSYLSFSASSKCSSKDSTSQPNNCRARSSSCLGVCVRARRARVAFRCKTSKID